MKRFICSRFRIKTVHPFTILIRLLAAYSKPYSTPVSIGLSLNEIRPLINAFLNNNMSKSEALDVLSIQFQKMEQRIAEAQKIQAQIREKIELIQTSGESGKGSSCKNLQRLRSDKA